MRRARRLLPVLLPAVLSACASGGGDAAAPGRPAPSRGGEPLLLVLPDPVKRAHRQVKPTRMNGTVTVDRPTGAFFVQPPVWVAPGRIPGNNLLLEIREPGADLGVVLFELQNHGVRGSELTELFEQIASRGMIEGRVIWRD